ncbi:hypothetical protein AKO1_002969 [Acrasis kona]|uniref:Uncharacterized protein n=1 Tax=Acrasis kona TaxID=1008807 RepID=A0AAW2Z7S2_9EUKA
MSVIVSSLGVQCQIPSCQSIYDGLTTITQIQTAILYISIAFAATIVLFAVILLLIVRKRLLKGNKIKTIIAYDADERYDGVVVDELYSNPDFKLNEQDKTVNALIDRLDLTTNEEFPSPMHVSSKTVPRIGIKKRVKETAPNTPDLVDWFFLVESNYKPVEDEDASDDIQMDPAQSKTPKFKEKIIRKRNLDKEIKLSDSQSFAEKPKLSQNATPILIPDLDYRDMEGFMEPITNSMDLNVVPSDRYSPNIDQVLYDESLNLEKLPKRGFLNKLLIRHKNNESFDNVEYLTKSPEPATFVDLVGSPDQKKRSEQSLRRSRVKPSNIVGFEKF